MTTFLEDQFTRLEGNGYSFGHYIRIWKNKDGTYSATCDQRGGYVTDKEHDTPEAAILHAMVCAERKS